MTKTMRTLAQNPVADALDPEVIQFRAQFGDASPLDELLREGAQRMLQTAIESEVDRFIAAHSGPVDDEGRRLVVRNGRLPARELLTGAGKIEVQQPRVRDHSPTPAGRVRCSSSLMPPYLRRSKSIEEFVPLLYLRGVSTGVFAEVITPLFGEEAKGL